jgi:carbamoyltransferase
MIILGISPPSHESALGVIIDGKLVAAAAEERFTRVKNQGGFPHQAFRAVLKMAGVEPRDIDAVAFAWLEFSKEQRLKMRAYASNVTYSIAADIPIKSKAAHLLNYTRNTVFGSNALLSRGSDHVITDPLKEYGLAEKIIYVDHHVAHVASAYFASGFDRALAVSLDGYGSGAAGSFYLCEGGRMRLLQRIPYPHSLGTFYRHVTKALGFKPNRHEGKIVGLAAYGDPSILYDRVYSRFDLSREDHYRFKSAQDPFVDRELASEYPREHVAAAYQKVLEDVATHYIRLYADKYNATHVVAAGGVFANVKMNQRVLDIPGVERVFIFPAMSDGGVGVGAALYIASQFDGLKPFRMENVYLGPGFTEREIDKAVRESNLPHRHVAEIELEIARLVAEGKVVARFDGKMEFGPRALGNRSILCQATDPTINKWLNDRLKRTEFMPFAPATPAEDAHKLYERVDKGRYAAEFMTVTFDCTDEMKRQSPAAVHVDGTARPQLVSEQSNPGFYRVLKHYHKLTGLYSMINTSFNMHEEPIVCTPADANRAFSDGRLDYLAAGNLLVSLNNGSGHETK